MVGADTELVSLYSRWQCFAMTGTLNPSLHHSPEISLCEKVRNGTHLKLSDQTQELAVFLRFKAQEISPLLGELDVITLIIYT